MSMIAKLCAAAAGLVLLAGCAMGTTTMPSMHGTTSPETSSQTTTVDGQHNAADEMFVSMMIPHHAQAVELSDLLLAKGDIAPAVRTLAERIKAAQQPEIEQMKSWLGDWQVPIVTMPGHDMPGMGGMLTDAQVKALADARGAAATKLFLEGMIQHHVGAIAMADGVLDAGVNTDVRALAKAIITSQSAEIKQMQTLLKG